MNSKEEVLLLEVSRIFETLDYKMNPVLSVDDFYKAAIKKLNRAASLDDASIIIESILRFGQLFNNFTKALANKDNLKYFNELRLLPLNVNYLDDSQARDIHTITNALTPDYRRFFMSNLSYDGEHVEFNVRFHKISGVYYWASIPFGKKDNEVNIYDKENNLVLSLTFKGKKLHQINNDVLDLIIVDNKKDTIIYQRSTYPCKQRKSEPQNEVTPIAVIETKLVNNPSQIGVARYKVFNPLFDNELFDFIALAKLVLIRKR